MPAAVATVAAADPAALAIPKAAVKRIMKLDPEVTHVQAEAVVLVAKATEIFLERLAKEAFDATLERSSKSLRYSDVADARANNGKQRLLLMHPSRYVRSRAIVQLLWREVWLQVLRESSGKRESSG